MKDTLKLRFLPAKNLRAHPLRTLLVFLLAAAQAACVLSGLVLTHNIKQELTLSEKRLGADILLYPSAAMSKISADKLIMQGTASDVRKPRSQIDALYDCEGVAAVSCQVFLRDTTSPEARWIVGCDPETDFVIAPWLSGGGDKLPPGITVGSAVSANEGRVTLFCKSWPVAARLEKTGSPLDEEVFADPQTFERLTKAAAEAGLEAYKNADFEKSYSVALLRVEEEADPGNVTNWLNKHIRKVKAVCSDRALGSAAQSVRRQLRLAETAPALLWSALLLALVVAQTATVKERRRELYFWRVLGASRALVLKGMLAEAATVYSAGALCGVALSALVTGVLLSGKAGLSAMPLGALTAFAVTVLVGCSSTLIAVLRAGKAVKDRMLSGV